MADAMYAPVVTRFMTYDVKLTGRCGLRQHRDAMPEMQEWIEAARRAGDIEGLRSNIGSAARRLRDGGLKVRAACSAQNHPGKRVSRLLDRTPAPVSFAPDSPVKASQHLA